MSTTTTEGATARPRIGAARLLWLTLQFAIVVALVKAYHVQSTAFFDLCLLALGGFVVHALLPMRHRLRFFVLLSAGGIVLTLGPALGALVLACSAVLIGLCHAPIPFWARSLGAVACGAFLAVVHVGWVHWTSLQLVVPVLGSMFMFRIIVCLYDLSHADPKNPPTVTQSAAYFLLLPNVCFPLFPVVDYNTSIRTYYAAKDEQVYGNGIRWMATGVVHILFYRVIHDYVVIDADDVFSLSDRVRFLVGDFLLYTRVSGQFHIAVGMLHMFGFNLPRTHDRFYGASSFTDLWRRINIYWTSFMQKVFFYPVSAYLRKRKLSPIWTTVLASTVVIVGTWILHPYQTFWLRRRFPITLQDGIFWIVIGVLLIMTTVIEMKRGRKRSLAGTPKRTPLELVRLAVSTAATFATMSVLWSMWSIDNLDDWWPTLIGR